MKSSNREEFAEMIVSVLSFYKRDVSEFALTVWWETCKPFDLEQVTKAFTRHATDPDRGQFPPMPADIIRQLGGTSTDRSLLAWQSAYRAVGEVGGYRSVEFEDKVIHAVIHDLGGWSTFCATTTDELPHLQRRFTEMYRTFMRREGLAPPLRLIGRSEADNSLRGYTTSEVARIAAPAKQPRAERLT